MAILLVTLADFIDRLSYRYILMLLIVDITPTNAILLIFAYIHGSPTRHHDIQKPGSI